MRIRPLSFGVLWLSSLAFAEPLTWTIDSGHSAVHFAVRHMMVSTVRGDFGRIAGTATFDATNPAGGSVEATVDVASVNTRQAKRDAHLRSADFFEVEKYPTMTFKSKRVESAGNGKLKLVGDLTIKGTTKEVAFDVEGPSPQITDGRGGHRTGATAIAKIKRSDYGITWNRAIEAGGVTVGDEVTITIDLELIRRPTT